MTYSYVMEGVHGILVHQHYTVSAQGIV
jgi:hypothetical protein